VDFLDGGNGVDTIQGGDGDDVIANGTAPDGADTVIGGPGNDLSNYQGRTNPVNVSLDNVANDGEAGENDDVRTSVEKVFGGAGADGLSGSAFDNVLQGGGSADTIAGSAGNDTLRGNAGDDSLFGGDDNDVLQGGTGADSMAGGPGMDKADYSDAPTGIDVTIDDVANDGTPAEGDNVKTTIENVLGGRFNDTVLGDVDANGLSGGLGADVLKGAGGGDTIAGGSGPDDLRGGAGPDELHAVDGTADSLLCGTEVDSYAADGMDTVAPDCENALP
jgi:Ca2+-binding RTX toxin-like protein